MHGRRLVLARVVWAAVVVFTLSIFMLSLPAYFAQLQTVCVGDTCVYAYGQLTPGAAQALQNLSLSTGGYAVSILALAIASALVSFGVAALIFWRRSDDWMAMFLGRYVPLLIFPSLSTSSSFYFLIFTYVYPIGLLLIPLTLGVAILRYCLWDIDILINRTLVYGTLTGLLALVYFGLVIALQALFKAIIGQVGASPEVIAISTLAIAALFQPLRHNIQKIIDRRFYRHKYDAARTLAAFSATLQNEVDLSQLSEHLLAVVQETMQPTSVSLWLRLPSQERRPGPSRLSQLNGVPGKEET